MTTPEPRSLEKEALESLDTLSSVPSLQGPLGRVIGWIDTLFLSLAVAALVAIAGTVLLQISGRLFLPFSLAWTEELSRYLFIYMVALSAGVVLRRNRNVSVELYHQHLGPRARAGYQALVCLLIGGFAWIVLPYAWQYAQNGAWQTSPTLRVPMLYIFFSTVVMFALLLGYSALGFIEGLIAMLRSRERR
ncbi:TRAP-type C4-dicarboxylate transport system, small permease component [Franzmannia pantelleriensis]|uniref:TRAP transporter small permease protein n=1 Tax=Franzmannia pantelleriensis TaxID=48727 RepID=A0A1G9IST4_9GAMM|nr:TRAP transporter small permease [Halomonas pantelleriensis]SDL28399.1 TRAP-type C4-dicarboxylate transport system, small permease component [Halomonas pantelleriensis]